MISRIDAADLGVLLDIRHPLAYLALHPALELAQGLSLDVDWLPLGTPTLHPPSPEGPDDDRGMRHRRYRARAIAREIETYGAAQGLVLREIYRDGDATAANLGWLWLRERSPERLPAYLGESFRRYWAAELDASSLDQVATLIDSLSGDAAGFRSWSVAEGPALAEALAGELRDRGLFQVPAFVLEDEVFYGRQHLPMIRWILGGRSGAVPI